ncbi:MAG: serine--tRNA ligase [Deltaproteobacteria bacterium]
MLHITKITDDYANTITSLLKRNLNKEELKNKLDKVISLNNLRKTNQNENDALKAKMKEFSDKIGISFKSGNKEEAEKLKIEVNEIKSRSKILDDTMKDILSEIDEILLTIPNVPHDLVPPGNSENDNFIYKNWSGKLPEFGEKGMTHWELAKKYNLIDFELGAFITGSGFPLFRGKGSKLERALINFFLDEAEAAGYEEIIPPYMVNEDSARATGQLPDKEGQMYFVERDNLYLIPTAEVPLTNIFRDSILQESELPVKVTGYTPCFRREAGSYGAHVKGLNRVHQFDKVEIVQISDPSNSYHILDEMVSHAEKILIKLELPYRIVRLCGGDLGFTSAMTYDFEVYSGGQKRWLEVSSVSNFETFQSNRMKLRYKDKEGKIRLTHTLNGSALALARIVAAILENNQTPEGIKVPDALKKYLNFEIIN